MMFSGTGEWAKADCPFCAKEDHFFASRKTGQANCKVCGFTGNPYNFMRSLWEASANVETMPQLTALSADRGIPTTEFFSWGLRVSVLNGDFIIPSYNLKGALANLNRIVKDIESGKWKVISSPGCKQHPFGTNLLSKEAKTLWVCEGPWDGMALSAAFRSVNVNGGAYVRTKGDKNCLQQNGVIAVPGCQTFNPDWLVYFDDMMVNLCFDNDHPFKSKTGQTIQPGWLGMKKVIKIAGEAGTNCKIKKLTWGKDGFDPELPSGYDLRDLFNASYVLDSKGNRTTQKVIPVLVKIQSLLKSVKVEKAEPVEEAVETVEPQACESFGELCRHFESHLHFNIAMRQTLAVAIATVISTPIQSDQLWFRIIGPPGSGKTTIAECLSVAREYCFPKSIVTGFHSGDARGTKGKNKKPNSLVPQMDGKCVIVKDADTLTNVSNNDKIMSELRDLFDGCSRSHYRNGVKADYESLRTTFLLCGTDALRGLNRSFLGERFLDIDILGNGSSGLYLDSAFENAFAKVAGSLSSEAEGEDKQTLKRVTYGYLQTLFGKLQNKTARTPRITPEVKERIISLGQLLSFMRARVQRDREELLYRPRAELATRLTAQFVKLAVCLCIVHDSEVIDDEILSILSKVMRDTANGFQFEISTCLHRNPGGCSVQGLALECGLSETTVRKICDDMQELKIITRKSVPNNSGIRGRDVHLWFLTDHLTHLFTLSGFTVKPTFFPKKLKGPCPIKGSDRRPPKPLRAKI